MSTGQLNILLPLPIYVRPCPRDNEVRKPGDGTEPEVQLGRKRTAHGDSESQGRLERNRSASPDCTGGMGKTVQYHTRGVLRDRTGVGYNLSQPHLTQKYSLAMCPRGNKWIRKLDFICT